MMDSKDGAGKADMPLTRLSLPGQLAPKALSELLMLLPSPQAFELTKASLIERAAMAKAAMRCAVVPGGQA